MCIAVQLSAHLRQVLARATRTASGACSSHETAHAKQAWAQAYAENSVKPLLQVIGRSQVMQNSGQSAKIAAHEA